MRTVSHACDTLDVHPTSTSQGAPTVPSTTFLAIPPAEHVPRRAILRRARYGALLAFPLWLRCAVGRNPTELAAFLLCARARVSRIVWAYRAGRRGLPLAEDGQRSIAVQTTVLMPWLTRALGALLHKAPRASGWGRPR